VRSASALGQIAAIPGFPGAQGVLPCTVPEHQNAHAVNGLVEHLIRVKAILGRRDYFVDLGRGLRLESALIRDSVAYLL
jgi:hypothetical protein